MIETERLIVRPFRNEDADALYMIKTDPTTTIGIVTTISIFADTGPAAL